MKYIWYLIALIASFAALVAYFTTKPHPVEKNIAISINRKQITHDEFNARFASVQATDRQDFINSLIVRELMIQDAQKEGIDKDEAFRRSIQDYYEQSLVKQVIDKKIKSLKVDVTDHEIDHFTAFQNSTVKVTAFRADNENAAKKGQFKSQETKTLRVNDFAGDISDSLESLKEGSLTPPSCSADGCVVFRLDSVTTPASETLSAENRRKARIRLLERKKQRAMDSWIADLRAKSDIRILIK